MIGPVLMLFLASVLLWLGAIWSFKRAIRSAFGGGNGIDTQAFSSIAAFCVIIGTSTTILFVCFLSDLLR